MANMETVMLDDPSYTIDEIITEKPKANIVTAEVFKERVGKVFGILGNILSRSYGPCGANTMIYNYPYSTTTKDGYTIFQNISLGSSDGTQIDQAIAGMASDICSEMNTQVGDGTTTAVIATNSLFQKYLTYKEELESGFTLPRDIMKILEEVKNELIEDVKAASIPVRSDDLEELRKNIYELVFISSNGNEWMSENIADTYAKLGCPSITCERAEDATDSVEIIEGFNFGARVLSDMYITSEDRTCDLSSESCDVIIFETMVTTDMFKYILAPANVQSKLRGRRLLCFAPSYDEAAMNQYIAPALQKEFHENNGVINLIVLSYRAFREDLKMIMDDFSVLMHTFPINRSTALNMITSAKRSGYPITKFIEFDNRPWINSSAYRYAAYDKTSGKVIGLLSGVIETPENKDITIGHPEPDENIFELGYTENCVLSRTGISKFRTLFRDEKRYQINLHQAENALKEAVKSSSDLGTFSPAVARAQSRFYSLGLKTAILKVGGKKLNQKMAFDQAEDAVKAAASAFDNGVVHGCSIEIIRSAYYGYMNASQDEDRKKTTVRMMMLDGYIDVYKTVLRNAFKDTDIASKNDSPKDILITVSDEIESLFGRDCNLLDPEIFNEAVEVAMNISNPDTETITLYDFIIGASIVADKAFDITTRQLSDKVVNSAKTDELVLGTVNDLLQLLITGNQLIITGRHNFAD